jgi:hypothetical protein
MLVAIFAFALAGADPQPVRLCSAMKIDVDGVVFQAASGGSDVVIVASLKSGTCTIVPTITPGDYTLRFIEHGPNGEAAMCTRSVTVKPGDTVWISPDDGAQCVL